eukprot:31191-Pelagococcus_subviridis.AAC.4
MVRRRDRDRRGRDGPHARHAQGRVRRPGRRTPGVPDGPAQELRHAAPLVAVRVRRRVVLLKFSVPADARQGRDDQLREGGGVRGRAVGGVHGSDRDVRERAARERGRG